MVDKVRPLKIERSGDGTEIDPFPTECDPAEDYLVGRGFSFENSDSYLMEKIGRLIDSKIPDWSEKPTYLVNGELDFLELFNGATQITANRLAKVQMSYDGSLNPTSEVWSIYDTNGTSVLRTVTFTHSFTSYSLTNSVVATT
jgi:hypothetical protein